MVNSKELVGTTKYLMLQTRRCINQCCYNWVWLYYIEKRRKGLSYIKYKEERLTGLTTLQRNCLPKHIIEWKIDGTINVMGRQGRRCKQLLDGLKETRGYWKIERGSTRSYSMQNSHWKRIWTCCTTNRRLNDHTCLTFFKYVNPLRLYNPLICI
jgi:macrodomain Ter protein organizer (MatP/YcbG family)